jgi:DNA-binding GntR family transcriptional regulator
VRSAGIPNGFFRCSRSRSLRFRYTQRIRPAYSGLMRASDRAYEALRDDILHWRLRPGTVLAESEQSARLGISRTPLREAVTRLAAEGLVDTAHGRAGVVTDVSPRNLVELFELREALETQASRLAARRHTPAVFEGLLAEFDAAARLLSSGTSAADGTSGADDRSAADGTSGADDRSGTDDYYALIARLDAAIDNAIASPYLVSALRGLRGHLARARRLAHDNIERLAESVAEHRLIVQAIVDSDETLAAQATAVHLRKSLDNLLRSVRRSGELEPVAARRRPKGTP